MRVYTIHFQNFSPRSAHPVIIAEGLLDSVLRAPLWAATHRMWFSAIGFSAAYVLIFLFSDLARLDEVTASSFSLVRRR